MPSTNLSPYRLWCLVGMPSSGTPRWQEFLAMLKEQRRG